jgi:hypothetical protein
MVTLSFETPGGTSMLMDGSNCILDWKATTFGTNALKEELHFYGTPRALFHPETHLHLAKSAVRQGISS